MELHAYTRTISDLFSVKRQYTIPRFQRPYSWNKDLVRELWKDIIDSLSYSNGEILNNEYFIGSLVLIGDDKSLIHQVVDGQQRLTTITILLSALCEKFKIMEKNNLAQSTYNNFIAGQDDDGNPYFKLVNENPKPFFQTSIQHIDKDLTKKPSNDEEKTLLASYKELYFLMSKTRLQSKFVGLDLEKVENYEQVLRAIRTQVTNYLKVIFITVTEEDEAYTIFETLNARGMNLSYVDLIKNKLFKELRTTHPDDYCKTTWKNIAKELTNRENVGSFEDYVRHFWLAQFRFVTKGKIYKEFQLEFNKKNIDPNEFLKRLEKDAKTYAVISSPTENDFLEQEGKKIYRALLSLKNFGIVQYKPFVLSLFRIKEQKLIRHKTLVEILVFLEKFHFLYNAVCVLPTNKLERPYAKAARELNNTTDNNEIRKIIDELISDFTKKKPALDFFQEKFRSLKYMNNYTKDKKIIQYIFNTIENYEHPTNEFITQNLTLEHILPQVRKKDSLGMLGNLLPLSSSLNEEAGDDDLNKKLPIYLKYQYVLTQKFSKKYADKIIWNENDILERTDNLSKYSYENVWNIKL